MKPQLPEIKQHVQWLLTGPVSWVRRFTSVARYPPKSRYSFPERRIVVRDFAEWTGMAISDGNVIGRNADDSLTNGTDTPPGTP